MAADSENKAGLPRGGYYCPTCKKFVPAEQVDEGLHSAQYGGCGNAVEKRLPKPAQKTRGQAGTKTDVKGAAAKP